MFKATRFNDVIKVLPMNDFNRAVQHYGNDKHSKGFSSRDQLLSMIYAQLHGCQSLRELETAYNSHSNTHYHLGTREVKRATLAQANKHRDSRLFESLLQTLLQQTKGRFKRELKQKLRLLDSTSISLKGLGYDDWAQGTRTRNTQGLKAHIMIDEASHIPLYCNLSPANVNDIQDAQTMTLTPGYTYVFDKGYCDYNWWYELDNLGAMFVTRIKKNAAIEVLQAQKGIDSIMSDDQIRLKNRRPRGGKINRYEKSLRRVVVERPDKETPLVLVTNDMVSSAQSIADSYKSRWQIELFFKWLKQNLKLKKFMGQSENAVRIQIYIAMISYLLVYLYRANNGLKMSLRECLIMVSATLMHRTETAHELDRRRREAARIRAKLQPEFAF
jgi:IS4 transposase